MRNYLIFVIVLTKSLNLIAQADTKSSSSKNSPMYFGLKIVDNTVEVRSPELNNFRVESTYGEIYFGRKIKGNLSIQLGLAFYNSDNPVQFGYGYSLSPLNVSYNVTHIFKDNFELPVLAIYYFYLGQKFRIIPGIGMRNSISRETISIRSASSSNISMAQSFFSNKTYYDFSIEGKLGFEYLVFNNLGLSVDYLIGFITQGSRNRYEYSFGMSYKF